MAQSIQVFPSIMSIAGPYQGILLDAYGVFWGGNQVGMLPGAESAMEQLVASGKIVGILSNTTQLVAKEVDKLKAHGLIQGRHFHFLTTSGEVAHQIFKSGVLPFATPRKTFWMFGAGHPKFTSQQIFQDTPLTETATMEEADFIYCAVPHIAGEDLTEPELFRDELKKIVPHGLPLVCANPDRFAQEGNPPRLVVRQGSIAALYEELGGTVFYYGKPDQNVYKVAMQQFGNHQVLHANQILMVGDTPETDIRGARQFGMHSALVTSTGMLYERKGNTSLESALHKLPTTDLPDFYIKQLGLNAV